MLKEVSIRSLWTSLIQNHYPTTTLSLPTPELLLPLIRVVGWRGTLIKLLICLLRMWNKLGVVENRLIRLIGRRDISPYLNIELSRWLFIDVIVLGLSLLLDECDLIE